MKISSSINKYLNIVMCMCLFSFLPVPAQLSERPVSDTRLSKECRSVNVAGSTNISINYRFIDFMIGRLIFAVILLSRGSSQNQTHYIMFKHRTIKKYFVAN